MTLCFEFFAGTRQRGSGRRAGDYVSALIPTVFPFLLALFTLLLFSSRRSRHSQQCTVGKNRLKNVRGFSELFPPNNTHLNFGAKIVVLSEIDINAI